MFPYFYMWFILVFRLELWSFVMIFGLICWHSWDLLALILVYCFLCYASMLNIFSLYEYIDASQLFFEKFWNVEVSSYVVICALTCMKLLEFEYSLYWFALHVLLLRISCLEVFHVLSLDILKFLHWWLYSHISHMPCYPLPSPPPPFMWHLHCHSIKPLPIYVIKLWFLFLLLKLLLDVITLDHSNVIF